MIIDGVDFWKENNHTLRMWDEQYKIGPLNTRISEKVRVGEEFTISLATEDFSLVKLLQKQASMHHECSMLITVENPTTRKEMYQVFFTIQLTTIEIADFLEDVIEISVHYMCKSAEDVTYYDSQAIREI
jgi:hypothetical protein